MSIFGTCNTGCCYQANGERQSRACKQSPLADRLRTKRAETKLCGLGIVGRGLIGIHSALEYFQWHEYDNGCRITAVWNTAPERANVVAEKYGVPNWYEQSEDMFEDENVNAVTKYPISSHYPQVL